MLEIFKRFVYGTVPYIHNNFYQILSKMIAVKNQISFDFTNQHSNWTFLSTVYGKGLCHVEILFFLYTAVVCTYFAFDLYSKTEVW